VRCRRPPRLSRRDPAADGAMRLLEPFTAQADEEIILMRHQNVWALLPTFVAFSLLLLLAFVAWWFTRMGELLFSITAVAFLALGIGYLRWYYSVLVVTNKRVAVRKGVIGSTIREAPLSKVQSTSVSEDLSSKLLHVGRLRISTGAMGGALEFPRLPDAHTVSRRIQDLTTRHEAIAQEVEMAEIKQQLRSRLHL